jgi:hypothetical protein
MGLATRNTGRRLSAYRELDHGRVVLYTIRFPHTAGDDLLHTFGPWMLQIFSPVGAIAFLRLRKGLASEATPLTVVPHAGPANEGSAQD